MDFRAGIIWILLFSLCSVNGSLKGKLTSCEKEGGSVKPPPGTDACIKCQCRDKTVQCQKPKCSESDGCYVLTTYKPKHSCCHTCRGCTYEGRELLNGELYLQESRYHHCQASVLTLSPLRCHVPCSRPTQYVNGIHGNRKEKFGNLGNTQKSNGIHGNCPLCPADDKTANGGCFHGDEFVANGNQVQWRDDKCTTCTCVEGQLSCVKKACPVLNCPESKMNRDDNLCCPTCYGSRQEDYPTNGNCVFRGHILLEGKSSHPDKCTQCTCESGTTVCEREVCPVLKCPHHAVLHEKGECCPRCKQAEPCQDKDGSQRKHAEEWRLDECTTCQCYSGTIKCQTMTCDTKPCSGNMIKTKRQGECCEVCVEGSARCSITGSGSEVLQLATFDKKHYKYAGPCKYTLARVQDNFTILIKNMYATPSTFAVKRLEMDIQTKAGPMVTVTMDTDLVAMVNGSLVKNGYKMGDLLYLEGKESTLTLNVIKLNVKITIGADGYTEVEVPRDFRGKLTGLCGDYDEDGANDMTSPDGEPETDTDKFVQSWRVDKCSCDRKVPEAERHSACSARPERRVLAKSRCDVIRRRTFKTCGQQMNLRPYYLTCLDNVCSCLDNPRSSNCECPLIQALLHDCRKLGLRIELDSCRPKLQHEAKFIDTRLTLAFKNDDSEKGLKVKKSRKSSKKTKRKSKKSQRRRLQAEFKAPEEKLDNNEVDKLKNELTKKHARKPDADKPRGPDAFLFG